jgi:solute carrier family 39 (zinc transporter), member 9
MLHKAPAAFGLVTFLMHEGLDRIRLRRHLLAFSLSAPIGAFVTYFGIGQSTKEALSEYNATGIIYLL